MKCLFPATCLALACAASIPSALATPVTQKYVGVITGAAGPQVDALPIGARININYTVDPGVADADPIFNQGLFEGGLRSLVVEVPDAGFLVVSGPGNVRTFNDEPQFNSDQVFMYSSHLLESDSLGNLPVGLALVEFREYVADPALKPTLLASEAVPTGPLLTDTSVLQLETGAGLASFQLLLEPAPPSVADVVSAATSRINELVDGGLLNPGVGQSLIAKLQAVLLAPGAGPGRRCGALAGLGNQIANLPRQDPSAIAVADELAGWALALHDAVGSSC
jgi:hypothetical protein